MKIILKVLLTAIAVLVLSKFLTGITVENYSTAIVVAIILGLLRVFVRPLIIFFTLPLTIVTLGLFLFVINAAMILLADYFVAGFTVNGLWVAMLFSFLLSLFQSILYSFLKDSK